MEQPDISIIGTGALGSALAKALYKANFSVRSLFSRTEATALSLSKEVEAAQVSSFPQTKKELGSLTFLTVPDGAIAGVAHRLADLSIDFSELIFAHCSGNESSAVLQVLKQKQASTAAFHPLQTFPKDAAAQDFQDIYFDVEGDRQALDVLRHVAASLGAETFDISAGAKPYLHAAAVVASNYLVALLDASGKIAGLGGINEAEARKALMPLISKTFEHAQTGDLSGALTGPIRRGDVETVRQHLQLLKQDENLLRMYKIMGAQALTIAEQNRDFSEEKASRITKLLNS